MFWVHLWFSDSSVKQHWATAQSRLCRCFVLFFTSAGLRLKQGRAPPYLLRDAWGRIFGTNELNCSAMGNELFNMTTHPLSSHAQSHSHRFPTPSTHQVWLPVHLCVPPNKVWSLMSQDPKKTNHAGLFKFYFIINILFQQTHGQQMPAVGGLLIYTITTTTCKLDR